MFRTGVDILGAKLTSPGSKLTSPGRELTSRTGVDISWTEVDISGEVDISSRGVSSLIS